MSEHFNTYSGYPQTKAEVESLTDESLYEFMGECSEEPADYESCLSCYAYLVVQQREESTQKANYLISMSPLSDDLAALLQKHEHYDDNLARHAIDFLTQPAQLQALLEVAIKRGSAERAWQGPMPKGSPIVYAIKDK